MSSKRSRSASIFFSFSSTSGSDEPFFSISASRSSLVALNSSKAFAIESTAVLTSSLMSCPFTISGCWLNWQWNPLPLFAHRQPRAGLKPLKRRLPPLLILNETTRLHPEGKSPNPEPTYPLP